MASSAVTSAVAGHLSPQPRQDPQLTVQQSAATAAVAPHQQANTNMDLSASLSVTVSGQTGLQLASFNTSARVTTYIDQCTQSYTSLRTQLDKATDSLANFKAASKQIGADADSGAAIMQPPRALQVDMIKIARFIPVDGHPDFYSDIIKRIQKAQQTFSSKIHDLLLKAKVQHVDHLRAELVIPPFCEKRAAVFRDTVLNSYADIYDSDAAGAAGPSALFPRQQAVTTFVTTLQTRVTDIFTKAAEAQIKKAEAKQANEAANLAAQEQVIAGAHTGTTIKLIAQQEAHKAMLAVSKAHSGGAQSSEALITTTPQLVTSEPHTKQSPATPAPATNKTQGFGPRRDNLKRGRPPVPQSAQSPAGRGDHPRSFAGHRANNRRDTNDRRANDRRNTSDRCDINDRHDSNHQRQSEPATSTQSADFRNRTYPAAHNAFTSASGHGPTHRSDHSRPDSKNEQGGDRRRSSSRQRSAHSYNSRPHSPPRDQHQSSNERRDRGRNDRYPASSYNSHH
jgi:hypothetical protein